MTLQFPLVLITIKNDGRDSCLVHIPRRPRAGANPAREQRPTLKPPHQRHQPDHDGDQQEQVRRFPNKYFADGRSFR